MSLTRKSYDKTTLAAALLPKQKAQSRISFDDEDDYITSVIARSIQLIERSNGFLIAPQIWIASPFPLASAGAGGVMGASGIEGSNRCASTSGQSAGQLPIGPVSAFTMDLADSDDVHSDVTTSFQLVGGGDPSQFTRQWIVATGPVDPGVLTATLTAGFSDADAIEPSIEDIVLRLGAWLYENREFESLEGFDIQATANSISTGLWRPTC